MAKNWFKGAVKSKPPYDLGGWQKNLHPSIRRYRALASRPRNWTMKHRHRSAAQALQALANVTTDPATKRAAELDAKYFRRKL